MGCKCNRVAPVIKPISSEESVPITIHGPRKQIIPNPNDSEQKNKNKKRTTYSSDEELPSDDHLINSLINPQKNTTIGTLAIGNDFVEIEVADAQAFNDSFIQQRQQVIDNRSYRSTIESWRPNTLQELVDAIKSVARNKSLIDCHWIIFYWVAYNIEYDTVSYFSKNYANQSAEGVFRTKKGVCAGYANIYKYLCDQLNLPCEKVSGYSKGYGFDNREGAPTETDHAWNVVEIDHHWYLAESTWGAGQLSDQKAFKRELNSYYFFARPNEMIYHHLPENEKWQLLRKPIKMTQYMCMPKLQPNYFELNLQLVSPRHQAHVDLLPEKPYALVLIRPPSDVHLMAGLELHDQKVDGGHRVVFDDRNQVYRCYFAPMTIGKHKVTIYGKRGDAVIDKYSAVLELTLNIQQLPKHPISFPETWKKFFDLNLKVISPKNTHLVKVHNGARHAEIVIQAPDDVVLLARLSDENEDEIEGADQVYYDGHKGLWRCQFAPNRDGMFKAMIMAKKTADTGVYTSAVSFKMEAKQISIPPLSYPKTWPIFFDLNLKVISPKNTHLIKVHNGARHAEIVIQAPDDVVLLARLSNENGEEIKGGDQVYYDRHKGLWRCQFAPNRADMFEAMIMAKKTADTGVYTSAVSFKMEAKQIPIPPLSYPKTWPIFYDLDLKIDSPRDRAAAVWSENASFAEIRISAPDDVQLSCGIELNGVEEEDCTLAQFDNDKQQWQLLFAPQRTGLHKLSIYARRQSDVNTTSSAVAQFDLNVTKLRNRMKFPLTYGRFQATKCRINEPLNGVLKRDAIIPIHCIIPGATEVNLQVDSKWIDPKGYVDPILKTEVTVGSKDLIIYAKYGQNTSFSGLVKYSVQ